ncbi:MAG: penicillin-binding protein 1B [Pseudohongiellaceae bacterium]
MRYHAAMTSRQRSSSQRRLAAPGLLARWRRPLLLTGLLGFVAGLLWFAWLDHEVRRDFEGLQWALPARVYARPLELFAGAEHDLRGVRTYLQLLGYRQSAAAAGPGEYAGSGQLLRFRTRGFDFWDGHEPSVYVEVSFADQRVLAIRSADDAEVPLVRLEPVEIEQINPVTGEDRVPVRLEDVPPALIKAVIAIEDQRFYSHFGVDPLSILRAMWANLRAGEIVQGGSTLTQQLIKNLYLGREQTLRRKAEEALMALALELHFSKDEILAAYLNEIFLGQDGSRAIHGFALAAEYYFGRPLAELRVDELALLAGIGRGASFYNPLRYPERAVDRRNAVLARMLVNGDLSEAEHAALAKADLRVREAPGAVRGYPAFLELVLDNLGRDYDQQALRSEGLKIFTTLDITLQSTLDSRLDKAVKVLERADRADNPLEAAVVVADANTGEVRALAGGRKAGFRGFNRALHAERPIGSLVKPAVYLTALETPGFNLATVLADDPIAMPQATGEVWRPQNYERETNGPVYLYDALQRSLNLATIDLGLKLGVDNVAATLQRLGFTGSVPRYPSLFLGAVNMTPLQVAQMYQSLASGGFRSPLRAVEAVTTAEGQPLAYYGIETEQVSDPASIYLLEEALSGVFVNGTARVVASRLGDRLPLAGKTGTTNDLRDSWFAGYGGDLVTVVWLGHDDNAETGLTGAAGALQVWADLMSAFKVQPRQALAPAEVVWESVPQRAVRSGVDRDCSQTLSLPFATARPLDVSYSCEVSDSFFDRVLDRFRNL